MLTQSWPTIANPWYTFPEKTGQIDILNTGHGHIEIRFDKEDVLEAERASRIIKDMMHRGYSLFVHEADGKLTRVLEFNEAKGVYVIADGATVAAEEEASPAAGPEQKKRGWPRKEVPIASAKVTAVGRSAGG
jgi:hypothetical protein